MRRSLWLIVASAVRARSSLAHAGSVTGTRSQVDRLRTSDLVSGTCTRSSSYATGGDRFGAASTVPEAGAARCDSAMRVPRVVRVEASKGGDLVDDDHTNRTRLARVPVTIVAGSATADANTTLMSVGATVDVGGTGVAAQVVAGDATATTTRSSVAVRVLALGD